MCVKMPAKVEAYPDFRIDLLCYGNKPVSKSEPKMTEKEKRVGASKLPDYSKEIEDFHISLSNDFENGD